MTENTNPLLIIISGPSGVGKDAILIKMKEKGLPFYYSVTATSRPQRPGEVDGVDYHFIDRTEFEKMIGDGEFLEWASVYGNLYGVPKNAIKQAMAEGKDAIVKVDIQGAATIKRLEPEAISIFISPPSMEELERRLRKRKTESGTNLELRLKTATEEMESRDTFDYTVVSQRKRIDDAISEIEAVIKNEKSRAGPSIVKKQPQQKQISTTTQKSVERLTSGQARGEILRIPRKSSRKSKFPMFFRRIRSTLKKT